MPTDAVEIEASPPVELATFLATSRVGGRSNSGGDGGRTLHGVVSRGSHPDEVAGKGLTRIVTIETDVPRAGLP